MRKTLILLTSFWLFCFALCSCSFGRNPTEKTFTLEAGSALPDASRVLGKQAEYVSFAEDFDLNRPGRYEAVLSDGSKEYAVTFLLTDQTPPQAVTQNLTVGIGCALPEAEDFLTEVKDVSSWSAEFVEKYIVSAAGNYPMTVRLTDACGNAVDYPVTLKVVKDTTPPEIVGLDDLSAYIGDSISYKSGLTLTDNCFGKVTLDVDISAVDTSKEGSYEVIYTATDASGNQTVKIVMLWLHKEKITEEMLWAKVDKTLANIIRPGMSVEEKCRAVYDFVHNNMYYMADTDKTDWVAEAYRAMYVRGGGDCFSFYAVGRAFLERLGIPYLSMERLPGYTEDTHYWLLVNIGTAEEPRWYHYDVCRLNASHSGCLLTEKQISAYNTQRPHFYERDISSYPKVEAAIITATPSLESYYR